MEYKATVIIPTYEREESLLVALNSLLLQDVNNFEIIVVDNAASDALRAIVERFAIDHNRPIRYVPEKSLGLHYARNRGVLESKTEILIFTDDDVEFPHNWVRTYIEEFIDPNIGAMGGKVIPSWTIEPPQWVKDHANGNLSILDLGDKPFVLPQGDYSVYGCNMAVRKSLVTKLGGFHPESFGMTWLGDGETGVMKLIQENGYDLSYTPNAFLWHIIPPQRMTVEYFKKRFRNQGASDAYTTYHDDIPGRIRLAAESMYRMLRAAGFTLKVGLSILFNDSRKMRFLFRIQYEISRSQYSLRLLHDREFRMLVTRKNWL